MAAADRVSLRHHPLTASAALVCIGDLPCPPRQMLFDIADSLTAPAPPQPTNWPPDHRARPCRG